MKTFGDLKVGDTVYVYLNGNVLDCKVSDIKNTANDVGDLRIVVGKMLSIDVSKNCSHHCKEHYIYFADKEALLEALVVQRKIIDNYIGLYSNNKNE